MKKNCNNCGWTNGPYCTNYGERCIPIKATYWKPPLKSAEHPYDFRIHFWTWDCLPWYSQIFYDGLQCNLNLGFFSISWIRWPNTYKEKIK